jgi:hypothetical protein
MRNTLGRIGEVRVIAFLVGAGATLAEALPGQPIQARIPPLDATFFDLVRKAGIRGQTALRQYLSAHYGLDPKSQSLGMEEVFNIVYADARTVGATDECLDAYWALLNMYRDAIGYTTNTLNGTSRDGIGALLRFFARRGERDFVFVTFNQDLVIEKAIDAAKQTRRYGHLAWDINTAYGVEFGGVRHWVGDGESQPFTSDSTAGLRGIKVLKLHGSLNWVYGVRSDSDARNALRQPRRKLHLLDEKTVVNRMVDYSGARGVHLLPFIVPPVYEKSTHIRNVVQPAWIAARAALKNADQIVIFGYSCPAADQAARNMIKSSFHQNDRARHLHVIDPSAQTAARLGDLLQARAMTRYLSVRDFVAHYGSA